MPPLDYGITDHFPKGTGTQTVQVTRVMEQTMWSKVARERLKELAMLPENWNGYGSPKIHADSIEESFNLLSEFAKLGMGEPRIVPISGGGVQLEWRNSKSELEIEILPNRSVQFLLVDSFDEMFEGQIVENGNMAEFTPLTCWFLNERESIKELGIYGGTY